MLLPFLEFSEYKEFDAGIKMNKIAIEFFCNFVKFSIERVMEAIKPLVLEKEGFHYWDKSLSKALFGNSGYQNDDFKSEFFSTRVKFSVDALMWETKPAVTEKKEFDMRDESFLLAFFRLLECQNLFKK